MRKLTKRQEREQMLKLMEKRERKTPEHHSPDWVAAYWRRIAS
jgi:hypothetical protein